MKFYVGHKLQTELIGEAAREHCAKCPRANIDGKQIICKVYGDTITDNDMVNSNSRCDLPQVYYQGKI